jgi:hypothetical protein
MVAARPSLILSSAESGLALSMGRAADMELEPTARSGRHAPLDNWWRVQLGKGNTQRIIGAATNKYIFTRLLLFLQDGNSELHWVLTLSETHVSFYGRHVNGRAELHLQDRDAKMFAELVLTPAEAQEWARALSTALQGV